jgi:hypothetical protein
LIIGWLIESEYTGELKEHQMESKQEKKNRRDEGELYMR